MATKEKVNEIYELFAKRRGTPPTYNEEKHCKILIDVMMNPNKGTISAFCVEAMICDRTFHKWVAQHDLFASLYYYSKMLAREDWEQEGRRIRDADFPMGTINYSYEYWKMIGWTRFGISKHSKIKVATENVETPTDLYRAILKQASEGDYTASEFKQLMEAVNVGVNVHNIFELQKQIDELKSAVTVMEQNSNVKNPFTDKGTA